MGSSAQVEEICDRGREASERRRGWREAIIVDLLLQPAARRRQICNEFQDVLNTSADLQRRWPATNAAPRAKGAELYIKLPSLSLRDLHSLTPDICKVVILRNERAASPLLSGAH